MSRQQNTNIVRFPTRADNFLTKSSMDGCGPTTLWMQYAQVFKRMMVAQSLQTFGCRPPSLQYNPAGAPLDAKLLYLDLPNDRPGVDAHCCVSGSDCKPCTIPHDSDDLPLLLQLPPYSEQLHYQGPPCYFTEDDFFVPVERLEIDNRMQPAHAQAGRNQSDFLLNVLETPPERHDNEG